MPSLLTLCFNTMFPPFQSAGILEKAKELGIEGLEDKGKAAGQVSR